MELRAQSSEFTDEVRLSGPPKAWQSIYLMATLGNAMQCNAAMQFNAMQYNAMHCIPMQYIPKHCNAIQYVCVCVCVFVCARVCVVFLFYPL